jgi:hypothetical protein
MAIKTITSIDDLDHPNGDVKFDYYSGIFAVIVRGGQEHDQDRLGMMFLQSRDTFDSYFWKSPFGAHGFGLEVSKEDGGWRTAIERAIPLYGGLVFHLSTPMVDINQLTQYCSQNNLGLDINKVGGFNYGSTPIQEQS